MNLNFTKNVMQTLAFSHAKILFLVFSQFVAMTHQSLFTLKIINYSLYVHSYVLVTIL